MRLYIVALLLCISTHLLAQTSDMENGSCILLEGGSKVGVGFFSPSNVSNSLYGFILDGNDLGKLFNGTNLKLLKSSTKILKISDNVVYTRIQLRSLVVFNDTILKSDKDRYRVLSKTTKDKVKMHFLDKEDAMLIYGKKGKYGALIIKSIDD